ncbi:hypothetical protein BUALT_Bualt17G0029200 [Buddleja alternifolia]|uniref:Uncharacterized protein n=1 Tax=Buddleja alternifolia TaxID=168488 RepID=A0AAV6WF13_9LAMI|nr:hypothetical protein BUALT_Bualt17G0029200 [Buddleja alternifolia]
MLVQKKALRKQAINTLRSSLRIWPLFKQIASPTAQIKGAPMPCLLVATTSVIVLMTSITMIGGFENLHGLREGWAWLARFLGFPVWLKYVPGIEFRTDNQPFKVSHFGIENEYGPVEWQIIAPGKPYSAWAAKMAVGLDTGVPWIMCKLETAPDPLYTQFGGPIPHRPVEDLAFSVATFVQNNGSFFNYYMLGAVWQELEEAGQAVMESEKKLKFREENSRSCHGCKRYAAEKSLRLADTRASRLRDQVEVLTRLLDELDTRETSRTGLTWPIYMPWPGQWLGLDYVSANRSETPQAFFFPLLVAG